VFYAPSLAPAAPARDEREPADSQWQQAPWAKVFIGLVLAQGLCYGLHNLTMAGFSFRSDELAPDSVWKTLGGLVLSHSLQAFSLIVGGLLSGAGQRHGAIYGCFLGLVNGALTLIVYRHDLEALAPKNIVIYTLPVLHMALGALGGLMGSLIWRPMPVLPMLDTRGAQAAPPPVEPVSLFSIHFLAGPTYLGRICIGIVIVVGGVGWSSAILQSVVDLSQGHLTISSHLQAKLVSWEIAALAALLGAGYAGANTFNGLKQGLLVGIGAGIIVAMIQLGGPKVIVEALALMVMSIVLLTVAGGWFGAQLFPPVLQRRRRLSSYA
jgi:hypothetical protein